ncbi:MAG: hypothetical protein ACLPKI_15020 [Streptosporangiaceae bacterium]
MASALSARLARPYSSRRPHQCAATTANSRTADAARAPRAVWLPGVSTMPPQKASPEASDSGMDSRGGLNQTCTMSPLATAMNSHSAAWPRMATGTQPPAASASMA